MSGGAIAATSGASAAAAARAAALLREEEEEMTSYKTDDLSGWEFKIVRSVTARFKDRQFVQQVCAEEAKAGWEMLEKFDDNRIRFKRRIEKREQDQYLDFDPYRTNVGFGAEKFVLIALGIAVALGGVVMLLTFMFSSHEDGRTGLPFLMVGIILLMVVALLVFRILLGRGRGTRAGRLR
ncbi:MAG: hypothetical protein ABIJ61_11380 [bacterium]